MIFRNSWLKRAFRAVADGPNPSDESIVHQLLQLLCNPLAFCGPLVSRELKILRRLSIVAMLRRLHETNHGPVRGASSQRIGWFSLRFSFLRLSLVLLRSG